MHLEVKKQINTRQYTSEDLKAALHGIISGELMQANACRMYNIPRSTLTAMLRREGLYAAHLKKFPPEGAEEVVNNIVSFHYKNRKEKNIEKKKLADRISQESNLQSISWDSDIDAKMSKNGLDERNDFEIKKNTKQFNKSSNSEALKKSVVLLACGSYNPITNMHLRMFELAKDYINEHFPGFYVEQGIISPVSDGYKKKGLLKSSHRINMCNLAVQDNPLLTVSSWEAKKSPWSPTVNVLEHHAKEINSGISESNSKSLMLLCGADFLESFNTPDLWKKSDVIKILSDFGLVVISRNSANSERIIYENDLLYSFKESIHLIKNWCENNTCSTHLRRCLRRNHSIRYLTPDPVIEYISELNLYQPGSENINEDAELAPLEMYKR